METAIRFLVLGGGVLCLLLQTFFRVRKPEGAKVLLPESFWLALVRGTLGVFFLVFPMYCVCSGWLIKPFPLFNCLGYALVLIGITIRIWAQFTLGRNWSTGVATPVSLTTSGPYRYVRHPMYSAYFLFAGGMALLTMNENLMMLWVIYLLMIFVRALNEEEMLEKRFGEKYREWECRTGMIFPSRL